MRSIGEGARRDSNNLNPEPASKIKLFKLFNSGGGDGVRGGGLGPREFR